MTRSQKRVGSPPRTTDHRENRGRRRNHVIPKFHMRNFAIEDRVYVFDFAEERRAARYTPPRPNVNNATVFRGFYTDKLEDSLSQRFESGVDTLLGKVTEEQQLTFGERKMLSRYLYAYMLRGPWMLNHLQYRYEPDMRHSIKEVGDRLSFVYAALYASEHRIDNVLLEEVKGVLSRSERELSDVGMMQSSLRALFSEGSLLAESPTHFDALVASLPWRVFISTNQPFVLGDFFFRVNGPDQPVFELYCPISSTHCLLISRYAPEPKHATENIEYLHVREQTVRAINVRTVVSSVRYVISGRDLSWVTRAYRTPPRNHLNLKVPNMQTDQLVGGYKSARCPNCWWALSAGEVVEREMGEIKGGVAGLNTFTQRVCSNPNCGFTTGFQSKSDVVGVQLGTEAAAIRRRLRPADRDIPPMEETE